MVTLQVKRTVKLPVEKSLLLKAARATLALSNTGENSTLSLVIADDALLQKLNRQYRQLDSATDVLSFPSGDIDPDSASPYLGDVVISLPRAQQQAAMEGHPLADELQLLVVHGVLHLLGYDHLEASDKKRMQAVQDQVIKKLHLDVTVTL